MQTVWEVAWNCCMCAADSARESSGRVLVHCLAGISRSPTIVIAYIMHHLRLSIDDAYRYRSSSLMTHRHLHWISYRPRYARVLTTGLDIYGTLLPPPLHARHICLRRNNNNNNNNNIRIMFMVQSSWLCNRVIARVHSVHAMNTETAPGSRRPLDQANRLGPQVRLYIGSQ